jgi:hypothetical protein
MRIIMDTGAAISFISEETLEVIRAKGQQQVVLQPWHGARPVGATNHEFTVVGAVELQVHMGNSQHMARFAVVQGIEISTLL